MHKLEPTPIANDQTTPMCNKLRRRTTTLESKALCAVPSLKTLVFLGSHIVVFLVAGWCGLNPCEKYESINHPNFWGTYASIQPPTNSFLVKYYCWILFDVVDYPLLVIKHANQTTGSSRLMVIILSINRFWWL